MAYTVEQIFSNPAIEKHRLLGTDEYIFWLKGISTGIAIRLRKQRSGFEFSQSHVIKTPLQGAGYRTSRSWDEDKDYALHRAVGTVTDYYNDAVAAGHTPSDSWIEEY